MKSYVTITVQKAIEFDTEEEYKTKLDETIEKLEQEFESVDLTSEDDDGDENEEY